jgi:hypothetical protein
MNALSQSEIPTGCLQNTIEESYRPTQCINYQMHVLVVLFPEVLAATTRAGYKRLVLGGKHPVLGYANASKAVIPTCL